MLKLVLQCPIKTTNALYISKLKSLLLMAFLCAQNSSSSNYILSFNVKRNLLSRKDQLMCLCPVLILFLTISFLLCSNILHIVLFINTKMSLFTDLKLIFLQI